MSSERELYISSHKIPSIEGYNVVYLSTKETENDIPISDSFIIHHKPPTLEKNIIKHNVQSYIKGRGSSQPWH